MARTKLPETELRSLSDAYGIAFTSQDLPQTGNNNQVVFLRAPDGKYVVKGYAPEFTPRIAGFQARVNDFVYGSIPAPRILRNVEGNQLTFLNGRRYVLMTYLDGRHPSKDSQEEINLALQGLAQCNRALASFTDMQGYDALPRFMSPLSAQFSDLLPLLPKTPQNQADEYVLSQAERIGKQLKSTEERISRIRHPKQLIHGDFNLECALVKDGQLSGILDYDFLRMDHRGADVLHTIDLYCFDKETPGTQLDARVDWEKLKVCFEAYKAHDPEIVEQIPDLPLMLAHFAFSHIMTVWGYGYRPDATDRQKDYFNRRYSFFVNRADIALQLEDRIVETLRS